MTNPPMMDQDERDQVIWSMSAWVGMNPDLSVEARHKIFRAAINDVLPNATASEIGYALGRIAPTGTK
jgi:hypothetical protein